MIRLAIATLCLCSCVAALSNADIDSLHDTQKLNLEIYRSSGPSTIPGALSRAAFCSDEAVLRRNDASTVDTDSAIQCQGTK